MRNLLPTRLSKRTRRHPENPLRASRGLLQGILRRLQKLLHMPLPNQRNLLSTPLLVEHHTRRLATHNTATRRSKHNHNLLVANPQIHFHTPMGRRIQSRSQLHNELRNLHLHKRRLNKQIPLSFSLFNQSYYMNCLCNSTTSPLLQAPA